MINRSLSTNILIETKIIKLNVCEIFNQNRLQTGSNPGSLPSSSCDIHQFQTCVRNSCSAFATEPNKYRKRFQKNFIRKSGVLSVQEGMFACIQFAVKGSNCTSTIVNQLAVFLRLEERSATIFDPPCLQSTCTIFYCSQTITILWSFEINKD